MLYKKSIIEKRMPEALRLGCEKIMGLKFIIESNPGLVEEWAKSTTWCLFYPDSKPRSSSMIRECLGESVHVVLRKYMSNKFEEMAYEAHHVISDSVEGEWGAFLDTVAGELFKSGGV